VSRCRSHVKKLRYLPTLRRKGKAEIGATRDWENAYGGGGIPPTHAKKFSVAMVKRNFLWSTSNLSINHFASVIGKSEVWNFVKSLRESLGRLNAFRVPER